MHFPVHMATDRVRESLQSDILLEFNFPIFFKTYGTLFKGNNIFLSDAHNSVL